MQPFGNDVLKAAAHANRRLILLLDPKDEPLELFATSWGFPYVNLTLALGERLLPLTPAQRRKDLKPLLEQLLDQVGHHAVIVLDRIELLFDTTLAVEPVGLLRDLAVNRILIVCWPGVYGNGYLTYGDGGHPDSRTVHAQGLIVSTIPTY